MKQLIPISPGKRSAGTVAFHGILTALILIIGFVEHQFILVPAIPGIKLGLSNVVLLFALCMLSFQSAWILMFLKVLLSALLFSGFSGMSYALCGGILSLAVMCVLLQSRAFSIAAISIGGACAHMIGQVLCSRLLLGTWAAAVQLPYLLIAAILSGLLTGIGTHHLCRAFMRLLPSSKSRMLSFKLL